MRSTLLLNLAVLTGLWLALLAGLGTISHLSAAPGLRYTHTGGWTLYQDPSGQASVSLRDLRPI